METKTNVDTNYRREKCENITRICKKRGVLHTWILYVPSNVIECCESARNVCRGTNVLDDIHPCKIHDSISTMHSIFRLCWYDKLSHFLSDNLSRFAVFSPSCYSEYYFMGE